MRRTSVLVVAVLALTIAYAGESHAARCVIPDSWTVRWDAIPQYRQWQEEALCRVIEQTDYDLSDLKVTIGGATWNDSAGTYWQYERRIAVNGWLWAEIPVHVLTHEFGHAVDWQHLANKNRARLWGIYTNSRARNWDGTWDREWFAEAFMEAFAGIDRPTVTEEQARKLRELLA